MRRSDQGAKNHGVKSAKEIKAILTDSGRVIAENNQKRKQNVMVEMVNVLLNRDLVNTALEVEQVFAGNEDSPRLKKQSEEQENSHYLSYLYSAEFDPVRALPRNAGRMSNWYELAFAGNNKTVNEWTDLLKNINEPESSVEDKDMIRKAVIFYCCARYVEGEYLKDDTELSKILADLVTDIPSENELANQIQNSFKTLQQSEFVVQYGALADKIDIINLVLDQFDRTEKLRSQNEKQVQAGLPSPIVRMLVHHINRLVNELNPNTAKSSHVFFKDKKRGKLLNEAELLTGMLEQSDANQLLGFYQSNKQAFDSLTKETKLAVTKVVEFLSEVNQFEASQAAEQGSPRRKI